MLVFGILGLVLCGALGPVAWWKGNVVLQEIDQNPAAYSNRGSIQVGRCLGIVASCLLMLTVGAIVLGACASLVDGVT